MTLLCSIVRSPLISVSRLELSTAEAGAFISRPRQSILREVYLVAKEEEKRRKENDLSSDLIVHLPHVPVSPSAVSPEGPEKRCLSIYESSSQDKENVATTTTSAASSYSTHSQKRKKHHHNNPAPRLSALQPVTTNYDGYSQPFTFSPSASAWREPTSAPAHLYSHEAYGSDYGRSPNPDAERYHPNHLAPILNHHHTGHSSAHSAHSHCPIDSPAFPHSATLSNSGSAQNSSYYSRGGYMQQQQMDYLHSHSHGHEYDYGSPYLADNGGDNAFATAA